MENEDKNLKAQEASEEKKREEAQEAIQEATQEEIEDFANERPNLAPNSFWGQRGTWWILGIAGILIIFIVIWVCFFYGPN